MSGLAKPLVKFSTSKTPNTVVGVEHLSAVDKLDTPALPNQPLNTASYNILFVYQYPEGTTKNTLIGFTTDTIRNTALAAFHLANTVTI